MKPANACYCILDENWQGYASEVCSIYARFQPDKIMIDDDFRSLNHRAPYGCFCPIHTAAVSERLGITLTSEALLMHITGKSETDRKVRTAWMETNFEGQLHAARKIREAVKDISPFTQMGLMNSGEPAHSIQGRDMNRLLHEFSGPAQRPVSRPIGGGYNDLIRGDFLNMLSLGA